MDYIKYFEEIGMNNAQIMRANFVIECAKEIYSIQSIESVIVCDLIKEGERIYHSIWLRNSENVYECKNFLNLIHIDKAFNNAPIYMDVKLFEFNPKDKVIAEGSRIYCKIQVTEKVYCEFNGVKNNSVHVYEYVKKHYLTMV